jgi:hypothetical protein
MSYVDIREPGTNHLLFRYDPTRRLIEIKNRERLTIIDLEGIPVNHPSHRHPSKGDVGLPTKGGDLKLS